MLGAAEDLVREGRNHGIGVVLLDQRAAVVNKNVLALVEVLIVLRTIHHLDRKTFGEWVVEKGDGEKSWLEELPSLKAGEAYLYAPVLELFVRITMRMPRTFNATATARIGERTVKMGTLSPVDVGALRESMAQVIAEAEKNDPRALKREIAQLRAELAKKPADAPPAPPERIEVPAIKPDELALLKEWGNRLVGVTLALIEIDKRLGKIPGEPRSFSPPQLPPEHREALRAKYQVNRPPSRHPAASKPPPVNGEVKLGKGELAVLTAIAQHLTGVTREQLSVLTGYKRSSRDTYLQKLGAAGMLEQHGEKICASNAGVRMLGDGFEPLPTGEELRQHWLRRLPEGERRILEVLIADYPNAVQRDALDEVTGYKRSSRDTYLQKLGARRLVEMPSRGEVVASATLFA
jgi:hypothetical protein